MPHRTRSAFTLVEIIIALTLLAVGAAGLGTALMADRRLRDAAAVRAAMAAQSRSRLATLAATRCDNDLGGIARTTWGSERWSAGRSPGRWSVSDSLVPTRTLPGLQSTVIETEVTCPR